MKKKKKKITDIPTKGLIDELANEPAPVPPEYEETDVPEARIDPAADQVTAEEDLLVDPEIAGSGILKEKKKTGGQVSEDELETLRSEIETNLPIAIKSEAAWMREAREDIDFCLGEQWEEQEKNLLKSQGRPVMVFNKIKPLVQLVTGHLIQTKARIQAYPEGGEDETFTAVMDKAIDHIEKVSHLNFKLSYLFSGGEKAGKNWMEFHMDYDDDPIFGQLKIPNLGPFKVFMDPQGTEYDLSDCGFGFKIQKLTKSRLKQLYPKKEKEIDEYVDDSLNILVDASQNEPSGEDSDYGNDPRIPGPGRGVLDYGNELKGDQQACTTIEYWKKKYVDRWFIYFVDDGAVEEFDSEEEAKAEIARRQKMKHDKAMTAFGGVALKVKGIRSVVSKISSKVNTPPPVDDLDKVMVPPRFEDFAIKYAMRKRKVVRMQVAVLAGSLFLTNGLQDSPFEPFYSGFPFFRFISEWSPESDSPELRTQGIVRSLKDPQREKNKARSQYLHILNTSANSGWIGDEDALTQAQKDELRDFGAVAGITIWKKKGSQLDRIHPVEGSSAELVREKAANDDFKEVSGVNSDLLAMQESANPSGKAIALRIRQAITILQPSFENFRYTKLLIGQFLFSIIPTLFDSAKLEKVLGQRWLQENKMDRVRLDAYLTMIKDGKYNVSINEAGAPDTIREETFEDLMQLAQAGVSMPPDLFIDYMNMSNKGEVLNRVRSWTQAQMQAQAASKAPKQ